MSAEPPQISPLVRLIELTGRSLHSLGYAEGLYPAQWSALRYLAHAAPMERTAAKLARFQQLAVGPVTRTIRTLAAKGLVAETGMAAHHRSKRIDLTPDGIALLSRDPLLAVENAISALEPGDRRILADMLARIISATSGDETGQDTGLTFRPTDTDEAD